MNEAGGLSGAGCVLLADCPTDSDDGAQQRRPPVGEGRSDRAVWIPARYLGEAGQPVAGSLGTTQAGLSTESEKEATRVGLARLLYT